MRSSLYHLKLNGTANIISLVLMATTLCLKQWAEVHSYEYSLREIKVNELGGWIEIGSFKKMCTDFNISKYPDIKSDCDVILNYEFGGIMVSSIKYLLFAVFAMSIQCYNIMSSFASSAQLGIDIIELEFPHLLAPISHTVAIIVYLICVNAAFTDFHAKSAFWMAIVNILFNYLLAIHYKVYKNVADLKGDRMLAS